MVYNFWSTGSSERQQLDGRFIAELAQPAPTRVGDRHDWYDDTECKWHRGVVTASVDAAEETYSGASLVEFVAITKSSKAVVVKAVTGAPSRQAAAPSLHSAGYSH